MMPDGSPLRDRSFRRFWVADLFERFASGLRNVALPWLILELTGSPFQLGVAFALRSAPDVVVAPLVGAAIDRLRRGRLLVGARGATGTAVAVLAGLAVVDRLSVVALYVVMLILSVIGNVSHNTRQTLVPALVEDEDLDAANAWLFGSAAALGVVFTLAGGVLTTFFGPGLALGVAAGAYLLAGIAVLAVRIPERDGDPGDGLDVRSSLGTFRRGLTAIRTTPLVLDVLVLGVLFNFLVVPYRSVLLPTVGDAVFGSVGAFTALVVASQVGKVAGNAVAGRIALGRRAKIVAGIAVVGVGAGTTGVVGHLFGAGGGLLGLGSLSATLFVVGVGNPLFNAPGSSVVQSAVADDVRGTVITVQNSVLQASFPLPLLGAGVLLSSFSPFDLFLASGACALALVVGIGVRWGVSVPTVRS